MPQGGPADPHSKAPVLAGQPRWPLGAVGQLTRARQEPLGTTCAVTMFVILSGRKARKGGAVFNSHTGAPPRPSGVEGVRAAGGQPHPQLVVAVAVSCASARDAD